MLLFERIGTAGAILYSGIAEEINIASLFYDPLAVLRMATR